MNAKELRVGNLVRKEYYDTGEKTYEEIYTVRGYDLSELEVNGYIEHNDERLEPIPLTEEWLLKFGFIDYRTLPNKITKKAFYDIKAGIYLSYDGKYKHTKFRILYNPNTNTFQVVSPANNSIILKYVHQLQNLFFALTNNELTI